MKSVADSLRQDQRRDLSHLSTSERIALALELGHRAVRTYAAASGVSEDEARRVLRRSNRAGRRRSRSADAE